MPNIYLKVTIGKNRLSQKFDFLSVKNLSTSQFLWSPNSNKPFVATSKIRVVGAKLYLAFLLF